ncbi:hypothetical protein BRARA_K01581 [Brassica rapa]|uniref:DUF4283 domain-containing protein n=1 Tax=Brassica campestris TaxID=3711 RepID=A0A397L574_BRACM|nr:hypothetical protein BRARA_K01581 [Brassica rapa]
MTPRYTEAEKGKHQMRSEQTNSIKRIKAPNVDNTALIKDNALTLIGRLTNPQEQKIWALIPALPRKWNLQGRVTGSDLGNNCFQFRFEREDDLRRVLDNRPYHFAYWMVIIQRWEPIISNSFPSMIPFWIRIKGLPLHFWHEDMVVRVGQELGMLENHELTKTTARVRVHVDGLKPLIKESIIEFDSGEESLITLEYEKLETHCSKCASLLHARRNCPVKAERGESIRPEIPRAPKEGTNSLEENSARATTDQQEFNVRRDRHGNPFGERISTKQTRVPPPVNAVVTREINTQNWRSSKTQDEPQRYSSPQYTQNRQKPNRVPQRGRDLFPQREQAQWRPRLVPAPEDPTNHSRRQQVPTTPTNLNSGNSQLSNGVSRVQTIEEVIEDLHHVTRQYLNCADPVEAAARKQRVMQSDANGDMEETAAAIIAIETRRHELSSQQRGMDSNPNTPPPRRDYTIQELLGLDPSVGYSPLIREEEAKEVEPSYIEVEGSPKQRSEGPAKLKSIIIRSPNSVAEAPTPEQETQVATEEEETLLEFQNKVKRRSRRNKRGRSPRNNPIILRGASSKKRKLSQIQSSPLRKGETSRANTLGTKKKNTVPKSTAGPSQSATNPPIRLIPAMTKKRSDFRVPPPRVP